MRRIGEVLIMSDLDDKERKGEVQSAYGLCHAVQIAKDLREFILKAPQGPKEKNRDEYRQGEIVCNHHHKKNSKYVYACKFEAHQLTQKRIPETQNKDHEDHIAERGFNSVSHHNFVHKNYSYAQGNEDSKCEGRS